MDTDSEYHTLRNCTLHTYSGSLKEAVDQEFLLVQDILSQKGICRRHWDYIGADCAPLALYVRWQPGRITIASIAGLGSQKGRLPLICSCFEGIGLTVRWEAVSNEHLRQALRRRGYISSQEEPCFSADLTLPSSD